MRDNAISPYSAEHRLHVCRTHEREKRGELQGEGVVRSVRWSDDYHLKDKFKADISLRNKQTNKNKRVGGSSVRYERFFMHSVLPGHVFVPLSPSTYDYFLNSLSLL
eukprot:gene1131-662_t